MQKKNLTKVRRVKFLHSSKLESSKPKFLNQVHLTVTFRQCIPEDELLKEHCLPAYVCNEPDTQTVTFISSDIK